MKLTGFLGACLLASAAALSLASPAAAFSVTLTIDENGNGRLTNTNGFSGALPAALQNDPGPGGLNNVLTYDLLNPPGLTSGDVAFTDADAGGAVLDIVRFNASETCGPNGDTGCLVFYSDNIDGFDALADTVSPPGGTYTNVISLPEVAIPGGDGVMYTPTAGQPGFVAGAGGPVTYILISDKIPEPATLSLLGAGLLGFAGYRRRKA